LRQYITKNSSYPQIVSLLRKQNNFNGKIYAYPPADATFYVLLNQKPPYYNAVYEDNSVTTQNEMIKYMQVNKVGYITLDLSGDSSLQDGVPYYIREPIEFNYILNNYYPWSIIGNHLILKKGNQDFFNSPLISQIKQYMAFLLNVKLGMIPYSEGLYKYHYFSSEALIKTDSLDTLNNFLKAGKMSSSNKVLVLIPSMGLKTTEQNYLNIKSTDGKETAIYFNACKINKPCIINFTNIPLFYKDRQIKSITFDSEFKGNAAIYNLSSKHLW